MAIFKCKMCGGTIEFEPGATVGVCDSCGTKQTVSATDDEKRVNLFNRANHLRMNSEFDKAAGLYEQIVAEFPNDAEAYWGLCLCNYGIEYVDDPATGNKIPTIHRASFEKMRKDENYERALENADMAARLVYQDQAKEIDRIMGEVLAISQDEKPYDIFICYKETDEIGGRTVDSVIAQNIYDALTDKGYKVFFSRITLEDKLGKQYEPYIFAALNSARVMLAVGTDYEYYNAVWVKNEWRRFWKLAAADKSKVLIPCYKDMDAYDFPNEFKGLQAQDMGKVGAMQDLIRGIDKIFGRDKKPAAAPAAVAVAALVTPLLERAFMFLEDEKWADANAYSEKVLDVDPKNAEAYLGKLMAELQITNRKKLADCAEPFDDRDNYKKVLRFSDEKLEAEVRGYITHINERNENERLMSLYRRAVQTMGSAKGAQDYITAANRFGEVIDFQDSRERMEQCLQKAEACRKDGFYDFAKASMTGEKITAYEKAIMNFQKIPGWKDADEQIVACQKKIEEIKAKEEAARLEAERKAEEERLEAERKAEEKRLEAERKAEERRLAAEKAKKLAAIITPIVAVCIAFVIVLTTVIIPNSKYNAALSLMKDKKYEEAISAFKTMNGYKDSDNQITAIKDIRYDEAASLMNDGKYEEAMAAFEAIDGYKDSAEKFEECENQRLNNLAENQISNLSGVKKGDTIKFGFYEQDNNTTDGKEEIEWIVLNVENNKALVISKYALDCQKYNSTRDWVTWETCSLRTWMNGTFLNNAFSAEEQAQIQNTNVSADKNPEHSTNPGNATTDKVFLLSIPEVEKYYSSNSAGLCKPTEYAVANGACVFSGNGNCWWWLRSPGFDQHSAANVSFGGSVNGGGISVNSDIGGVRPAMWIDFNKFSEESTTTE